MFGTRKHSSCLKHSVKYKNNIECSLNECTRDQVGISQFAMEHCWEWNIFISFLFREILGIQVVFSEIDPNDLLQAL